MRHRPISSTWGLFALALMSWGVSPARVLADSTPASALDWESCVREAVRKNTDLLAAIQSWNAADEKIGAARGSFLPQLSLGSTYSQTRTDPSDPLDNKAAVTFSATQNLFAGFSDIGKVREAEAKARSSRASLRASSAKLSYDLKSAFSGLQYAQSFRSLAREIVERREENLRLVELRFEGGRENKGSLLLSRAVLSQARLESTQATHSILTARRALAQVLATDDWEKLEVTGTIPLSEPPANPDLKALATEAPDRLKAVADEEAASASLTQARSEFFPTLSLTASAGRQDTRFFPNNDRWSLGGSISIPLFSGFKDLHNTRSATASLAASRHTLDSTNRDLLTRLQQAHADWVESVLKEKVDQDFLQAALARAEIARNKYNNGLLSFEDWDLIESDLITRQKNALKSRRDRVLAEANWEKLLGKEITE